MEAQEITFSMLVNPHLHDRQLPMNVRQSLYFVLKEALTKLLKDAATTTVEVQIKQRYGQLKVTITDDERSFDPQLIDSVAGRGTNARLTATLSQVASPFSTT